MGRKTMIGLFALAVVMLPATTLGTNWDFDGDGKVGLSEAIMALQVTADIRVEQSQLLGVWGYGETDGDYNYPNGQYAVDHYGIEKGFYQHDNATGDFQISNITDNNGQYGLAANGWPYEDTIIVSGDILDVSGEVIFTRVK